MDSSDRSYADNLRGSQDIFLADIMNSAEFIEIKERHLSGVFTGIESLVGRVLDDESESSKIIRAAANEVSMRFKLKETIATKLLLSSNRTLPMHLDYVPRVYNNGKHVYIRIGAKTSQEDIMSAWKQVKEEQKKLGKIGSKSSPTPELAFCIYRQHVLKKRKMKDVFDDYLNENLEGYHHKPTIPSEDIDEFRKRYKKVVRGLLIP